MRVRAAAVPTAAPLVPVPAAAALVNGGTRASTLGEAPLHLPPLGMRPHLLAGVAPQVEETIGDRRQPYVRAPAIGTREAADGRMRLRALLPSVHVVLRIIGHVAAWLEGPGPARLTIRPSYTYSLGVIHHAGLERITRSV